MDGMGWDGAGVCDWFRGLDGGGARAGAGACGTRLFAF
jgi:hypothetical protein